MMPAVDVTALPAPPKGKTGWPWTPTDRREPAEVRMRAKWPRVTVVTPSFNQARFIEETLRSVLMQGYPNLEYFVLDGGSTDGSVEIIRRYEPWLAKWRTGPDGGQVHAVQAGWDAASGEILAYLNSDDAFLPGSLFKAARTIAEQPEAAGVCGGELKIDAAGMVIGVRRVESASVRDLLLSLRSLPQPSVFLRRRFLERVGGLDPNVKHGFDYDLWLRLAAAGPIVCIPETLASTRWHDETKTLNLRPAIAEELNYVIEKNLSGAAGCRLSPLERRKVERKLRHKMAKIHARNIEERGVSGLVPALIATVKHPSHAGEMLSQLRKVARKKLRPPCDSKQPRGDRVHWSVWSEEESSQSTPS